MDKKKNHDQGWWFIHNYKKLKQKHEKGEKLEEIKMGTIPLFHFGVHTLIRIKMVS